MNSARVTLIIDELDRMLFEATARCVETLRAFVALEPAPGQIFSCFELWSEEDYGLGYNRFSVVESDGQKRLDTDWSKALPEEGSFLPEVDQFVISYFGTPTRETELSEAEGTEFTQRHNSTLFTWFASCWRSAGGGQAKIPTYFCFQKEYKVRNLATGEVLAEEEAARRLGHHVV